MLKEEILNILIKLNTEDLVYWSKLEPEYPGMKAIILYLESIGYIESGVTQDIYWTNLKGKEYIKDNTSSCTIEEIIEFNKYRWSGLRKVEEDNIHYNHNYTPLEAEEEFIRILQIWKNNGKPDFKLFFDSSNGYPYTVKKFYL